MKTIILLITISISSVPSTETIMKHLKELESNNRPEVIGDGGKAFGVLQIHRGAVLDVNRFYGTNYQHIEMLQEDCAEEVYHLYTKMGIERYRKRTGAYPSEKRIVQMWNFGIYQQPYDNGYYKKYLKIKHKK